MVYNAFARPDLEVFTTPEELHSRLCQIKPDKTVYLLMSSGNFGGIVFEELADELLN